MKATHNAIRINPLPAQRINSEFHIIILLISWWRNICEKHWPQTAPDLLTNPELKQQIVQQVSSWYYKHQTPFNTKTRNNYIEEIMRGRKLIRKICKNKKHGTNTNKTWLLPVTTFQHISPISGVSGEEIFIHNI